MGAQHSASFASMPPESLPAARRILQSALWVGFVDARRRSAADHGRKGGREEPAEILFHRRVTRVEVLAQALRPGQALQGECGIYRGAFAGRMSPSSTLYSAAHGEHAATAIQDSRPTLPALSGSRSGHDRRCPAGISGLRGPRQPPASCRRRASHRARWPVTSAWQRGVANVHGAEASPVRAVPAGRPFALAFHRRSIQAFSRWQACNVLTWSCRVLFAAGPVQHVP